MTPPINEKKNVLGRGMNQLRGLEALASAMSKPMPLESTLLGGQRSTVGAVPCGATGGRGFAGGSTSGRRELGG